MIPASPSLCLTVADSLEGMRTGRLEPSDLVARCLERIAAREPAVRAWQVIDEPSVRRAAGSELKGPLAGLPVGIKDVIETADLPTEYGSAAYPGHRPASDAVCVQRLRQSGAIVLGKTVTTEFASFYPGKTRNPHHIGHTPGGSSSGSAAAVADGMVPVALGTQTAGSVIRPAAYCGAVGYKGTYGWSDMTGVHPLSGSLDTLGIFTRQVADIAPVRAVLANGAARAASIARAPAIGICHTPMWQGADAPTRALFQSLQERLKARNVEAREVSLPTYWNDLLEAQKMVMQPEMARIFAPIRARHEARISAGFLAQMKEGEAVPAERERAAHELAAKCRKDLSRLLPSGSVWIVPSAPGEAPAGTATGDPMFNRMWTLLGTPCITLPAGAGPNGLPLGLQLVAAPGADDELLDAALWFEALLRQ